MILNRDHFRESMEKNVVIFEYKSKMLPDDKWDAHAELVELSELYNVQILVFDSLESMKSITKI